MLNQELEDKIQRYISEFLKIPEFRKGFKQTHHYHTTVSDHSIHVAEISAKIGYTLNKMGMHLSLDTLIRGSLLHDIGIVDARKKTKKEMGHCLAIYHPLKSVELAQKYINDLSKREKNLIEAHMFPFSLHIPKYKESWVVRLADSIAPIKELRGYHASFKGRKCENRTRHIDSKKKYAILKR